jgi:dienelactone hydrolase
LPDTALGTLSSSPGFASAAAGGGRAVETRLIDGAAQAVAWDLRTGRRRVVTERPHGVHLSEIEPDGTHIWWFDGGDADHGQWCRSPFQGGDSRPALLGVPLGKPRGVGFDRDGALAAVCIGTAQWSRCFVGPPGGTGREVYAVEGHRWLADVSPDGAMLALAGAPDGPDAIVLCDVRTGVTTTLAGSRERRLWALEFDPSGGVGVDGAGPELLLMVERDAAFTVATWSPGGRVHCREHLAFPSTASAGWYPGGRRVLIQHEAAGRSRLLIADLDGRAEHGAYSRELPLPEGTVHDVSCAPDGSIHCVWSSAGSATVPIVIDADGSIARSTDERGTSPWPATRDVWTGTDYGDIHSFLTTPSGDPPWPAVFLVHGGPATHDRDSADPRVEALSRAGYAVVRTNYRGSTGYGPAWQHGFGGRVGIAQIEDLAAVRAQLVDQRLVAGDRVAVFGYSWGGYLALLAMGVQPGLWSAGVAVYPIGDYVRCFAETTPVLRDVDVALFGGTPQQCPDRYATASPITYAAQVRGPLLLIGATGDERCPAGQLESYIAALRQHGVPHRAVWRDGGHAGPHLDEQSRIMSLALGFLGASASGATVESPKGGAV